MTTYRIVATARATIEEIWTVEADSPAGAYDKLFSGDATLNLEDQSVLGDEENRGVERMILLDANGEEIDELPDGAWFDE